MYTVKRQELFHKKRLSFRESLFVYADNRPIGRLLWLIYGALLRYCFGQKTSMTDKVYLVLLPFASLAKTATNP